MNKLEMIRGTINLVTTLGVGTVVSDALAKIRPAQTKGAMESLLRKAGGFAIGAYITDKITEHVDKKWLGVIGQKEDSKDEPEIIEETKQEEA